MGLLDETHWQPNNMMEADGGDPAELLEVPITEAGALVCDPTYLTDYFNEENEVVNHIRKHSVLFHDDHGGAIYYRDPLVIIGDELDLPGYAILHECIGGDSGSLIMMAMDEPIPSSLRSAVNGLLERGAWLAALIKPAPGWYVPYGTEEDGSPVPDSMCPMVSILKRVRGIEPERGAAL